MGRSIGEELFEIPRLDVRHYSAVFDGIVVIDNYTNISFELCSHAGSAILSSMAEVAAALNCFESMIVTFNDRNDQLLADVESMDIYEVTGLYTL